MPILPIIAAMMAEGTATAAAAGGLATAGAAAGGAGLMSKITEQFLTNAAGKAGENIGSGIGKQRQWEFIGPPAPSPSTQGSEIFATPLAGARRGGDLLADPIIRSFLSGGPGATA